MPAAIKNEVKTNVIRQWLGGETRDKTATDNHIGAGTLEDAGCISAWETQGSVGTITAI